MTVWKMNCNTGASPKYRTWRKNTLSSITIATFTKLFAMRIVANSRSGLLKRLSTDVSFGFLSESNSFRSLGSSEKKATSEAEIKPEANNKNTATVKETIEPKVGVIK